MQSHLKLSLYEEMQRKKELSIFKIFKKKSVAFKVKEEKAPHKKKEFQRDGARHQDKIQCS